MNDMSDAPRPSQLWARKGETITCINDHPVCDTARDIASDEPHAPANFTNWRQPEPDVSTHITTIRCTECKGVWIRMGRSQVGNMVYQIHFLSGGWR